jgi:predicted MarR family transcription regulator
MRNDEILIVFHRVHKVHRKKKICEIAIIKNLAATISVISVVKKIHDQVLVMVSLCSIYLTDLDLWRYLLSACRP